MKVVVVFLLLMGSSSPVFSYIDPGSGSAIMSAVIGLFVASWLVIKTYWYKIKALFSGRSIVDDSSSAEEGHDSDKT